MDDLKEKNGWMSVPQFGDWDGKCDVPDYSMDFTKLRESRKQNKKDFSRSSIGNEEELAGPRHEHQKKNPPPPRHHHYEHQQVQLPIHSPNRRRNVFSCFSCCIRA